MTIWLVTLILVVAMLLLITEKLPVDLTSIGIIVVLTITGILTPSEAIAGFARITSYNVCYTKLLRIFCKRKFYFSTWIKWIRIILTQTELVWYRNINIYDIRIFITAIKVNLFQSVAVSYNFV